MRLYLDCEIKLNIDVLPTNNLYKEYLSQFRSMSDLGLNVRKDYYASSFGERSSGVRYVAYSFRRAPNG